jgi:hypothetical protein
LHATLPLALILGVALSVTWEKERSSGLKTRLYGCVG